MSSTMGDAYRESHDVIVTLKAFARDAESAPAALVRIREAFDAAQA